MTATLTSFDLNVPGNTTTIGGLPAAIRNTKNELAFRIEQEHSELTSSGLFGGLHLEGSARCFIDVNEPGVRPNGDALDSGGFDDDGRLRVNPNTDVLSYRNNGAWNDIAVATGNAAGFAALGGRSGGQVLTGGIEAADDLTLRASFLDANEDTVNDITPGFIIFDEAIGMLMNDIPIQGLKMNSVIDMDSNRLTNISPPTTDNDALVKGDKSVTIDEVNTTGSIVVGCHGQGLGDGNTKTADIGFSPDYVTVGNDTGTAPAYWVPGLSGDNKRFSGATISNAYVTVAGNILTFPDRSGGNSNGRIWWYYAQKFNKSVNPS